jgi:hypothetical protein
LQDFILRTIQLDLDTRKPILTIKFRDADPIFAKDFLQALTESTDLVVRNMTLRRSTQYANYLESKLATVQLSDLRQVLVNALNQQETLVMMSSANTPFAAQPLGSTIISLKPTYPQPLLVLALGLILGLATGIGFTLADRRTPRRRSAVADLGTGAGSS